MPSDFELMNFFASQNTKSWCRQRIVVVKFEMENEELVGMVTLVGGGGKEAPATPNRDREIEVL